MKRSLLLSCKSLRPQLSSKFRRLRKKLHLCATFDGLKVKGTRGAACDGSHSLAQLGNANIKLHIHDFYNPWLKRRRERQVPWKKQSLQGFHFICV
jgi:hypothetical protein